MQTPSQKHKNLISAFRFRGQAIQAPIQERIFPAAETYFEGGVDGRGCFDWIFLVKYKIWQAPGCFIHVSITTPVVSALKNYYI
jgi:hypothetical protein